MKNRAVIISGGVLFAAFFISVMTGKYPVGLSDLIFFIKEWITGPDDASAGKYAMLENLFFSVRLPRIIVAALTGAALSVSGAAYQAMFVNPLVSPGLLGVLSGSSFGAAIGMLFFKSWYAVQLSTFIGGFAAVAVAVLAAGIHRSDSAVMLVLGGIISGAMFTALLSMVKYLADPYSQLPAIVYWLMGNLSMADGETAVKAGIPLCAGVFGLIILAGRLNVLSMGDEEARALGVNVGLVRITVIILATAASSLSVVLAGQIGWVGLLVPHVARMLTGPDNETLLPVSALAGAAYLVIVDDVSRLAFDFEIPPGILTALMGIPCFAFVLGNSRKGWR